MPKKKVQILDHAKISKIVDRISHQIIENFYGKKEIVIVGIDKQGYRLAERINAKLQAISSSEINLFKLKLDKKAPLKTEYEFDGAMSDIEDKNIVLVDDVLNSGRTLAYALRFLMRVNVEQIYSIVLIDRYHRRYPVRADFVGMTLSTGIEEHISVRFEENMDEAFVE